jgi:hypothetical protein
VKLAAQDVITFTWQAENDKSVMVWATNNKSFTVNWGDGSAIETKTGYGDNACVLAHTYAEEKEYTVIVASGENCEFTKFDCSGAYTYNNEIGQWGWINNQVSNLTLTNCLALQVLDCYDNQLQSLDLTGYSSLTELSCGMNQLTSLDASGCSALQVLGCSNNQLTNLDVSGYPALRRLSCNNNQLTNLDVSSCPALVSLFCYENQLPLSDLFAAHSLINDENSQGLGTQNLQPQSAIIGQELFADQSVFNGIFTKYIVRKNGNPASPSDYTVVAGKLTFNVAGNYSVTMTNDAIASQWEYPAKVIIPINAGASGILENAISTVKIYPNPTSDFVYIKTDNGTIPEVKLYSTDGRLLRQMRNTEVDLSGYAAGVYFLSIDGERVKIWKK